MTFFFKTKNVPSSSNADALENGMPSSTTASSDVETLTRLNAVAQMKKTFYSLDTDRGGTVTMNELVESLMKNSTTGKYSKRRRSNVAVIIVRIVFISSFLFYCLFLNHSFPTNPNRITNCSESFSLLQLYNYIAPASLFDF